MIMMQRQYTSFQGILSGDDDEDDGSDNCDDINRTRT